MPENDSDRVQAKKRGRPSRSEQEQKLLEGEASSKERLAETAMRLFAEYGFEGTSTRKIASEAKCNISLIAFYYGSKVALYKEALRRVRNHFSDAVSPLMEDLKRLLEEATAESLAHCLKSHLERILDALLVKDYSRERYMLLLRCMQDVKGEGKLLFEEVFNPLLSLLIAMAERIVGDIEKEKARMASWLLLSSVISVLRDAPSFFVHTGQIILGQKELPLGLAHSFASMLFAGFMTNIGAKR